MSERRVHVRPGRRPSASARPPIGPSSRSREVDDVAGPRGRTRCRPSTAPRRRRRRRSRPAAVSWRSSQRVAGPAGVAVAVVGGGVEDGVDDVRAAVRRRRRRRAPRRGGGCASRPRSGRRRRAVNGGSADPPAVRADTTRRPCSARSTGSSGRLARMPVGEGHVDRVAARRRRPSRTAVRRGAADQGRAPAPTSGRPSDVRERGLPVAAAPEQVDPAALGRELDRGWDTV